MLHFFSNFLLWIKNDEILYLLDLLQLLETIRTIWAPQNSDILVFLRPIGDSSLATWLAPLTNSSDSLVNLGESALSNSHRGQNRGRWSRIIPFKSLLQDLSAEGCHKKLKLGAILEEEKKGNFTINVWQREIEQDAGCAGNRISSLMR